MSRIGIVATALALWACGGSNSAPATHFTATLNAATESPATTSMATGTASYTVIGSVGYTNTGANVSYTINFTGLTTPAAAAHIHVGAPGVNGQIAIPFNPPAATGGTITGTFSAANIQAASGGGISVAAGSMDDLLAAMRAGNTYTNIHTSTFPDGEIRGQNQAQSQ